MCVVQLFMFCVNCLALLWVCDCVYDVCISCVCVVCVYDLCICVVCCVSDW